MSNDQDWEDATLKERERLDEELYQLHQAEITRSRNKVERLKSIIRRNLSKFDYDSIQEIVATFRSEISTRPEELNG